MPTTIFDTFHHTARHQPHKPALVYATPGGRWHSLTYAELAAQTERLTHALAAGPLTRGTVAALMTPPSLEFFPLALALLQCGVVPVVLDPAVGLARLAATFEETRPTAYVGNALTLALRQVLGWGRASVRHTTTVAQLRRAARTAPAFSPPERAPHDTAAIIYTTGSTGAPKGAVYTLSNLTGQIDLLRTAFDLSPNEVDIPAFPFYALLDVLLGVTAVIPDTRFPMPARTNPAKLLAAIQHHGVTNMFASPVLLAVLADYGGPRGVRLPTLRRVITAGAPATPALQQRFRRLLSETTDLFGIYGTTETLPIASVESREIFAQQTRTANGAGVCLGWPVPGVTVRVIPILDEPVAEWHAGLTVPPYEVGEITVQSAATTERYVNNASATAQFKMAHPAGVIHRTGDVGYVDEAGRLWYAGRKAHRVFTAQGVLFTEPIENIFNVHPQVYRTALVGVQGEPVLWVEPLGPERVDKATLTRELRAMAQAHPATTAIRTFLFMDKFPTDVRHNSKIIREALAARAAQHVG